MEAPLTVPEAAAHLRCCSATIYRLIRSGKLLAVRHGGGRAPYLVNRKSVEAYATPATDSKALDDKLGLVELPPIRVSREVAERLQAQAQASGVILQAYVGRALGSIT